MENFSKKKVIALAVLGVLLAALVVGMNFYTEHKEQFIAASTPTPQPVDASGPQTTQTVTIPDSALQNLNVEMHDYGALAVSVDSTAAESTLVCENIHAEWLTVTEEENGLTVRYAAPGEHKLSANEETPTYTLVLNTTAVGDLKLDDSLGSIDILNALTANSLTVNVNLGTLTAKELSVKKLDVTLGLGGVEIAKLSDAEEANITAAGSVAVGLTESAENYGFSLAADNGTVMVDGAEQGSSYKTNGGAKVHVETYSADITVNTSVR